MPSSEQNVKSKKENVMLLRKSALSNLQKQVNKKLDSSYAKYPVANVGGTVRVRVPNADRAHSVGRNILANVIEITPANFYRKRFH